MSPETLELQLFDWKTHTANQRGEASHEAYKGRQQAIVARRLWGGEPGWKS